LEKINFDITTETQFIS